VLTGPSRSLGEKRRIIQTVTLMTIGGYDESNGSWLPSVTFCDQKAALFASF
jgi:hypothetical protein